MNGEKSRKKIWSDIEEKLQGKLIGLVRGPGEDNSKFTFISADNDLTKVGEFIHYTLTDEDGNSDKIYCKIVDRQLVRAVPSEFLGNPNLQLHRLLSALGLKNQYLYEIQAQIIGRWDEALQTFVNPRIEPPPGQPIYLTPDLEVASIISGGKGPGQRGTAHIGYLLSRGGERVSVVMDVSQFASTHLAILAGTGSGKSYTAAVLIEELLQHYNRAAVLIADPHGEYSTLKEIETDPTFEYKSYRPRVVIKPPEKVKIRLSSLRLSDLRYILPGLTDKQSHFLAEAYRSVTNYRVFESDNGLTEAEASNFNKIPNWTLDDLKRALNRRKEESAEHTSTVEALLWKLDMRLRGSKIFDDSLHIPLRELFEPGQCTVLQLSELELEDQQIVLSTILRRVFYSRLNAVKGNPQSRQENLDFPVFILIEEAHRFAPAKGRAVTTNILKTILSEGRKFGIGIGVISQRPGKLDSDILSQCMTQLFLKIVNPVDQKSIAESVESAGKDLLRELPALTRGQVIISGNAIKTPVLCRVRKRHSSHGGESLNAPKEWLEYFSANRIRERNENSARLADTKKPNRRGRRPI